MNDIYSELFFGTGRELRLAVYSVITGAVMGAVYEIFRTIRQGIRHNKWAVMIEDVIFTLLFGIVYYAFSVELTKGVMRFFVLLGMLIGFAIYLDSLGKLLYGIIKRVLKPLKFFSGELSKLLKKFCLDLCGLPFFHKQTKKSCKTSCRIEQGDV